MTVLLRGKLIVFPIRFCLQFTEVKKYGKSVFGYEFLDTPCE
jgi:hypothetical protein